MRAYSVKLNGSHFIITSERMRKPQNLITDAMRAHHPYAKGAKRRRLLSGAKVRELDINNGVVRVQVGDFELI